MIDATHLKAHRTAASLLKKGLLPRCIGRTKGGLNSKLHAVCDGQGRPVACCSPQGQMSDHKGAAMLLPALPPARELLGDRGYDSGPLPRRPGRARHRALHPVNQKAARSRCRYDKPLYRQRHRIENVFGRLKDWRRIATRYDRCAHTFFSAICIAATVIFWLP